MVVRVSDINVSWFKIWFRSVDYSSRFTNNYTVSTREASCIRLLAFAPSTVARSPRLISLIDDERLDPMQEFIPQICQH